MEQLRGGEWYSCPGLPRPVATSAHSTLAATAVTLIVPSLCLRAIASNFHLPRQGLIFPALSQLTIASRAELWLLGQV